MVTLTSQPATVLLCLLFAATFNLGLCTLKVHCNKKDQEALLIFKQGVVDQWGRISSWSTNKDCCQWTGVQCNNITGRVTKLDLSCGSDDFHHNYHKSECLGGAISLPFSELEFLYYLDLSYNYFEAIHFCPTHASGKFPNLLYLDLSNNENLAMDNLQWISLLPTLEVLDLSGIDLHRETHWIQILSMLLSLSELYLRGCQLSHMTLVSPALGWYVNFTSLQILDLSENHFDSEIFKLVSNFSNSFASLSLEDNALSGQLPNTLLNLRNLEDLLLSFNKLNGSIPDWLGQFKHLKRLDFYRNSFLGPIPSVIGNLSSLIHLELSYNHLNGSLPESLGQLSNLQNFLAGGNSFVSVVSEMNFDKLSNLEMLDLSSSFIVFDFDSKWVPPIHLNYLELHNSSLGSTFPQWLYSLGHVHYLNMSSSQISSIIEDRLWSLAMRTTVLDLSNNLISGDVSNVLLNSSWIELGNNNFKGGLPRLSQNVVIFKIRNNSLSGAISPLLCHPMSKINKLRYLDISHNLLSGELPSCFMNWESLVYVNLGSNNLMGQIPDSMGSLSSLQPLHLPKNQFFGVVPPSIERCRNLTLLDLGENKFSGNIGSWMGQSMRALKMRSNEFNGSIPSEICQLTSLAILDLADNKLSGPIPKCLHNITAMASTNDSSKHEFDIFSGTANFGTYSTDALMLLMKGQESSYSSNLKLVHIIDLSCNNIFGTIPPELFSLISLQSLNLSRNHLTGKIPEEIGHMTLLETLDLSVNHFSGQIPKSLSMLSFLSHLNFSLNNFTGKIPLGTQLQSFDEYSFIGNPELCGAPLLKNCTKGEKSDSKKPFGKEDGSEFLSWFYIGMDVGFATGFWGVCATIFFNKRCRHVYFKFLDDIKDRIYVFIVLKMNSLWKCI